MTNNHPEPMGFRYWIEIALAWILLPLILAPFVVSVVFTVACDYARAIFGVAYHKIVGVIRRERL
jgi:hypothetical protein